MLLYNITVGIDKDVEDEWLKWVKSEYIPAVMSTNLFTNYKVYKVLHDADDGSTSYSIQCLSKNLDNVNAYFEHFAPVIQEKLRMRFRDKHVAFMTLLEEV
jgi:hypothetical protein